MNGLHLLNLWLRSFISRSANFENDLWADSVLAVLLQIESSPAAIKRSINVILYLSNYILVSQSRGLHEDPVHEHDHGHDHDHSNDHGQRPKRVKVEITEIESEVDEKDEDAELSTASKEYQTKYCIFCFLTFATRLSRILGSSNTFGPFTNPANWTQTCKY